MNGIMPVPGLWSEARNADGRVYYYNTQTKATQWTKPTELMTPAERALADQPWKEYTAEGGRKYWYNTETKTSSWEMPEVYKNALAQTQVPAPPTPSVPQFVAGGGSSYQNAYQTRDRDDYGERAGVDRQIAYNGNDRNENNANGFRGPTFVASTNDPEYSTFEEAEQAFMKMLKRSNVQQDWSWEQAMRATIKDPQYRALKDPKDRKAAFEKYVVEVRIQEKEKAKERLTKLRADFGKMLRSHPEIKHYTRWKTARPIIEQEAIFRSTNDDAERRQLFEEYIVELKKANYEFEQKSRKSALDELETLLGSMDLEPYTRWADAHSKIESNERFVEDPKFKFITKLDMLTSFQSHIKTLERNFNDRRQEEKTTRARRERQNRDAFAALLNELKAAGKTKAGTKWMAVYPEFQNDSRYTNLLGQPGSTPLDMFWDVIEEEERGLRLIRNDVYDVLEDKRFEMNVKTTFAEFTDVMASDRRTASIDPDILRLIHERLLEKVHKRSEEDKHASERQKRRLVDDLRSRIKHLDNPPVTLKSTWEVVRAQVAHTEEYKALDSEDLRKQAFEKVIRRLKEKDEDLEREREKDRSKRDYRDRSRDRDRGQRNGHSERRHKGRGSRTPEPDAYEADRRKAMADREVRYRETGKIGLSPTPRDRDKHERLSSRNAEGRLGGYDRDRRDRDDHYRSRMDPKGSRDELNYGEGGASSGGRRRRGESEGGESVGSRKRPRREKTPREKEIEKEKKEEVAIHSGSEEGEMVEEEITK